MLPVVAIVGRPNVGKSTLFNRICGQRKALVHDLPGVTRDRHYAETQYDGQRFVLVDTGGYEPENEDRVSREMARQAAYAVEEADVIILLFSAKEGLTPVDEELVAILRSVKKPVFYVVNKCDGPKDEEYLAEFYRLGVETLYALSAEHKRGFHDLLETMVRVFPNRGETPVVEIEHTTNISVIGRPNVGKSTLVNRLLGYERSIVLDYPGTTRDALDTPFVYDGRNYVLIDTAGVRRQRKVDSRIEELSIIKALQSIDRSHIALFLLDGTLGLVDQDIKVASFAHEKGRGLIILVNKWDIVEKDAKTADLYKKKLRHELKHIPYAPIMFISAADGKNCHKIMEQVSMVRAEQKKEVQTSVLNKWLEDVVRKRHPGLHRNKRVKFYYITQLHRMTPTFVIKCNDPEGVHFSYERYLMNQLRESFGFIGNPIRLKFEARSSSEKD